MGERDLARSGRVAAADQPGGRDRVVRSAKRAPARDRRRHRSPAGAGDPGGLDRLRRRQRGQDRRQPPCRHRLAGSGRPADQQAVAARRRDLERAPQPGLAAQVGEIGHRGAHRAPFAGGAAATAPPRRRAPAAARDARPGSPGRRRPARPPPRRRQRRRSPERLRAGTPRPSPWSRAPAGSSRRARARRRARRRRGHRREAGPVAASTAAAIARSKPGPALRRSAGARLAVIRCCGNSKPELASAARTRSRDSRTAASGRPDQRERRQPRAHIGLDPDLARVDAEQGEGAGDREHGSNRMASPRTGGPQMVTNPARSARNRRAAAT